MLFSPSLLKELKAEFPRSSLQLGVSLARLSSLRTGGVGAALFSIDSLPLLERTFAFLRRHSLPYFSLGRMSNVLLPDQPWRACLLRAALFPPLVRGEEIEFSAATPLMRAIKFSHQKGLMGMEGAAGIPGTIGGAVMMNAGTADWQTKDQLLRVKLFRNGSLEEVPASSLALSYRSSNLTASSFIFSAVFKFAFASPQKLKQLRQRGLQALRHRQQTQPLTQPSVGSTFKNPLPLRAGKLIAESGLKGERVGGIAVSKKHANFIVNLGNGTSAQALKLIELVQRKVERRMGVALELEVKCF